MFVCVSGFSVGCLRCLPGEELRVYLETQVCMSLTLSEQYRDRQDQVEDNGAMQLCPASSQMRCLTSALKEWGDFA